MKILSIESSAKAASVAICDGDVLVAQYFQNNGQTHSRTIMPMLESMLANCELTVGDIDVIAVAAGPGSFTGLRIGVAAAKGLAWSAEKPCCGVSTLEAMAWQLAHMDGIICPVMDARRNQVYNALFEAKGGGLTRLCKDRAIGLDILHEDLKKLEKAPILVGDGARLCYDYFKTNGLDVILSPPHLVMQSAFGVARAATVMAEKGELISAGELAPVYLRLTQAERERLEKMESEKREENG